MEENLSIKEVAMRKIEYSEEDREFMSLNPQGRAYLEYNDKVGGEPFGLSLGMPDLEIDEKYGGIVGMYHECIKQGITWEELLDWNGHSDELQM